MRFNFSFLKYFSFCLLIVSSFSFVSSTIVGISGSNDNGVFRVTSDNGGLSNALIDSETVVLTGNGKLRGDFDVISSQLKYVGNTQTQNDNDALAPFTNGARGTTSSLARLLDASSLNFQTTAARFNIFISEVSGGSEIVETGDLQRLFVYSQPNAVITDAIFKNIKVHEVYAPFSKFFNVQYIDTEVVQLNWEAGRLDRYGIDVPSTISGWFSWIGNGNGGNNAFWDWNPKSIDNTKIIHQSPNNDYYQGYTVSYKFLDKFTSNPVSDVRVVYFDDRSNVGGSKVKVSEYLTDGSGVLVGTVDTRDLSVGGNIQRPTLFILTNQSRLTGGTTATYSGLPNTYNYVMDSVSADLLVKSYLHLENPNSLKLSSEVGKIDADLNVDEFSNYFLTVDSSITETNMATVLAYSELNNLEEFYDRSKAEWRNDDTYPIFSVNSGTIDLGSTNLIVNSTSPAVYDYNVGSNTLTIKSNTFFKTSKLTAIISTGNITIDDSVSNDVEFIAPEPVNVTITSLPVAAGSNSLCKFKDNVDGNETVVFADGSGTVIYNTWTNKPITYVCDAVGYKRSDTFNVNTGSLGVTNSLPLEEYKNKLGVKLYGSGITNEKNLVSYLLNDNKFFIEYSASNPVISYESFFDKVDEIFSSPTGIDYPIEFDFTGGKFVIDYNSNLKLSPEATNTGDPEVDFISYISGNSNPHAPYVTIGPLRIIYPTVDYSFDKDYGDEYNFVLDEFKVLNVALNDSEVELMYKDQLRALEMGVSVTDYNSTTGDLDFDVTIPFIEKNQDLICDFYYAKK